jgi:hypothetical protein
MRPPGRRPSTPHTMSRHIFRSSMWTGTRMGQFDSNNYTIAAATADFTIIADSTESGNLLIQNLEATYSILWDLGPRPDQLAAQRREDSIKWRQDSGSSGNSKHGTWNCCHPHSQPRLPQPTHTHINMDELTHNKSPPHKFRSERPGGIFDRQILCYILK